MKKIALCLIAILVVPLIACAETPARPESEKGISLKVGKHVEDSVSLTGNTVYVGWGMGFAVKYISKEHADELTAALKAELVKEGFKVVDSYAKGYSALRFGADEWTPESSTSTAEPPAQKLYRIALQWDVNTYGKRPKRKMKVNYSAYIPIDQVWGEVKNGLVENLAALKLRPPEKNVPGKGDPGCIPRFGFDEEQVQENGRSVHRVTRVLPNSPALRSGMKVGDIVVAIDSIPYPASAKDDASVESYEKQVPVPLKLVRNGHEIRSSIRAQVMCDD